MSRHRIAIALALGLAVACSNDAKDTGKSEGGGSKDGKAAAKKSPEEHLESFLAKKGADMTDSFAWEHTVKNTLLHAAIQLPEMAALGPTGIPKAYLELPELDIATMKAEAKASWTETWEAPKGCKSEKVASAWLPALPDEAAKSLPEPTQAALKALAEATHFKVECEEGRAFRISVGTDGRVVFFVDDSELGIEDLLEENRFVGYMNQPDEF